MEKSEALAVFSEFVDVVTRHLKFFKDFAKPVLFEVVTLYGLAKSMNVCNEAAGELARLVVTRDSVTTYKWLLLKFCYENPIAQNNLMENLKVDGLEIYEVLLALVNNEVVEEKVALAWVEKTLETVPVCNHVDCQCLYRMNLCQFKRWTAGTTESVRGWGYDF